MISWSKVISPPNFIFMNIPRYQQPIDESNYFSCGSSFSAEEILGELQLVLNKNISQEKLRKNITSELAIQLNKTARHVKFMNFNDRIKQLTKFLLDKSPNRRPQEELNKKVEIFRNELLSYVAFVQMYGGLDPERAAEAKISTNFIEAFHYLYDLQRKIKWIQITVELKPVREEFDKLCIKTFTNILNYNITKFENNNYLIQCLNWLIDVDLQSSASQFLIPQIRSFYEKLQLQRFLAEPRYSLLGPAIKLSIMEGIDISDKIDQVKVEPENPNKFLFLVQRIQNYPHLEKNAIKAALETTNCDAVAIAYQKFPGNKDIEKYFYNRLAFIMNKWLDLLVSEQTPMTNQRVRESYRPFRKMTSIIGIEEKQKVLDVAAESVIGKALSECVSNHLIELNREDPMSADISLIIQKTKMM